MGIKFLEHTADVAYEVWGKSLEEVVEEAVRAMYLTFIDTSQIAPRTTHSIKVEVQGEDYQRLLFLILNEFLYLLDTKNFIFKRFKTKKIKKTSSSVVFEGIAEGDYLREEYKVEGAGVKAPTYHGMKIWKEKEGWRARIVLDI